MSFYIPPKLGVEREGEEEEHNLNPVGCGLPVGLRRLDQSGEVENFDLFTNCSSDTSFYVFIYLLSSSTTALSQWPSHHIDAQVLHYSPSE